MQRNGRIAEAAQTMFPKVCFSLTTARPLILKWLLFSIFVNHYSKNLVAPEEAQKYEKMCQIGNTEMSYKAFGVMFQNIKYK